MAKLSTAMFLAIGSSKAEYILYKEKGASGAPQIKTSLCTLPMKKNFVCLNDGFKQRNENKKE